MNTAGDDFTARPEFMFDRALLFHANPGVVFSKGDSWRDNRRVCVSILRDFGMGGPLMEDMVSISLFFSGFYILERLKMKILLTDPPLDDGAAGAPRLARQPRVGRHLLADAGLLGLASD